ncbi:DUF1127 domain-containing protein [Yoonia sp. 208BN28-4]|uniref:DUF1127 domain-containing protein n=1 Tax=Yoonia sp. 208BN28-4 TaxID=3126505 RepID=UPI0030A3EF9D
MAYANNTRTVTIADRFNALVADFAAARKQRRAFRTTYNELSALSNRELADMGINRSMIKSIALDAAKTV